jgi:pimeloyl-ACP methyl ester carboxylesterase/membrane protease YdiL (CAAX protease family)
MTLTETRASAATEPQPESPRRTRLRLFLIATYVPAYVLWGLVALAAAQIIELPVPALVLLFVGGLAPAVAAVWAAGAESGTRGIRALLSMLVRWRVQPAWYAVALLGPALVVVGGLGLGVALGSPVPPVPPASAWLNVPLMFGVFVLLGAFEEIGWRGYALPRLLKQLTPVRASLLLGMIWGVWHAPQWFIPQTGQSGFPFPAFLVWVCALSVMFTWIFNGTRGSVLLVVLTHAATNAFQTPWLAALAQLPASERGIDPHLLVMAPQIVVSLAIVAMTRGRLGLPDGARMYGRASKWRSLAVGLLGGIVLLGGIGAFVQATAANWDGRAFPPPGEMVDVGGHRLHLQVMGDSHPGPTVILDAGMASFSTNWHWVQSDLAPSVRVVAYDRAGLGWSEPGPAPRDARQSATELHVALQRAGIGGPYVMAGHSYGGLVARMFTDLYPEDVTGLVLVDASHPDQWVHIPASLDGRMTSVSNRVFSNLASVGVFRFIDPLTPQVATGLPAYEYAQMRAILAEPASTGVGADALAVWHTHTRPQLAAARPLGNLPLTVLSVTEQPHFGEVLTTLQSELVALSSNSQHQVVAGATHEDLISNREHAAVVADAILQVADSARR